MRLIDADKLLRFFTVDTANQTYRFGTIKKQIENAETVQAIPIPNNATNRDIIKAMFPNSEIYTDVVNGIVDVEICEDNSELRCSVDWLNAPYAEKRGSENG